ncbi:MAG TPA: glycosyltransferase [Candidatus Baltobacteraceae bacterium]|jgi:glycosyltransferase involved in cell wall biosynthesis|nr:glycosyltransferase [Candidatus Baltobacteraceae bacterium]
MPRVSICVPNLNCRPFLPERFETIFNQTFRDWELIVCDSFSDDGAWDYIQELARREPRMRISQTPRKGIYAGFNDCIRQARGDYVYIATSDDTMTPDCLSRMISALEEHPQCGLCQCALEIIDENGVPLPAAEQWNHYPLGNYDQNLVSRKNRRLAPHDGLVHPALFTIYTSITQLLIRRTVFDRIGLFDGRWGSISDFEWEMRAGLVENCIYIPEKLATWRLRPNQATQDVHTPKSRLKMIEMTGTAFARARACEGAHLKGIDINDIIYFLQRDVVAFGYEAAKGRMAKLTFLAAQLFQRPGAVAAHVWERLQRKDWGGDQVLRYDELRRVLKKYNVPSPIFE